MFVKANQGSGEVDLERPFVVSARPAKAWAHVFPGAATKKEIPATVPYQQTGMPATPLPGNALPKTPTLRAAPSAPRTPTVGSSLPATPTLRAAASAPRTPAVSGTQLPATPPPGDSVTLPRTPPPIKAGSGLLVTPPPLELPPANNTSCERKAGLLPGTPLPALVTKASQASQASAALALSCPKP